eukprot:3917879-Prymnesium_polylepis.1
MSPTALHRQRRPGAAKDGSLQKTRGPQHRLPAPCHPGTGPSRTQSHRPIGRTYSALWGRL